MSAASPLEVLHPDGVVRRVRVLGRRDPGSLLPAAATEVRSAADLTLLLPSGPELRRRRRLGQGVREAVVATRDDGLVYAVVPRRARRRVAAELRRAGLTAQTHLAHLPADGPVRYLVPLHRPAWPYALGTVIAARPVARRALAAASGVPLGLVALRLALPTVGILAGRDAAPLAWIARLEGSPGDVSQAVVTASFRGAAGATVVHAFAAGADQPWGVVKVAPGPTREDERLASLGAAARDAGARVPRVVARGVADGRTVVAETPVGGRPAADVLGRAPHRAPDVIAEVAGWLGRWNAATARTDGAAMAKLVTQVLDDAAALFALTADREGYRRWLAGRCEALHDGELPLVARHNDLTMWNVVLEPGLPVGVLDWGEAEDAGLPLTDFFYAVVDAVAASQRYRSRLDALRDCFPSPGTARRPVAAHREALVAGLGISAPVAELCFHACWLHHARREAAAAGPDGGFVSIARWLAAETRAGDR